MSQRNSTRRQAQTTQWESDNYPASTEVVQGQVAPGETIVVRWTMGDLSDIASYENIFAVGAYDKSQCFGGQRVDGELSEGDTVEVEAQIPSSYLGGVVGAWRNVAPGHEHECVPITANVNLANASTLGFARDESDVSSAEQMALSRNGLPRQSYSYSGNEPDEFRRWVVGIYTDDQFETQTLPGQGTNSISTGGGGLSGEQVVETYLAVSDCGVRILTSGEVEYFATVEDQTGQLTDDAFTPEVALEWRIDGEIAAVSSATPVGNSTDVGEAQGEAIYGSASDLIAQFGEGANVDVEMTVWVTGGN